MIKRAIPFTLTLLFTVAVALIFLTSARVFAAAQHPADLFGGNSQWKLTIPKKGGVQEIKPPAFGTYTNPKYFYLNAAKTAAIFRVWHGEGTTSGSSNPRSELRERVGGDPEGYWSTKGTHIMEVVTQVNHLTKVKPHVVIAQVHGSNDDVSVWRVEGNRLYITQGDNAHGYLVDPSFDLGRPVTLKYVITNGTFNYYYNGQKVNYSLKYSGKGYFKVGNYLQSNKKTAKGESTSAYSEVELYCAKVAHNAALPGGGCTGPKQDTTPAQPTITGEPLTATMTAEKCRSLDRKIIDNKFCAKRKDGKTVPGALECVDPKPGYAKFTYIVDAADDYCGYY